MRSLPAGLPSKAGPLPVQAGPRPGRHSQSGGPRPRAGRAGNSSDRSAASSAARRRAAGGSETSVCASSGRSTARSKAGTPTAITLPNAIRAAAMTKRRCEYKAHLLQAAPAPPDSGQNRWRRDYVRLGGRLPAEIETVFNASRPLGPGRDQTETRAQRENPPPWPEFRQRPTRRRFAKHREVRSIGSQQRRMAVDI